MERAIRRVPTPGAPRGVTTTRAPDAGLPPDLLREASRRLGLKEPERRPPDGPELARRLEACAHPQQWTERKAQEWWRDHMPAAAGAAWEAGVSGDRSAFASTV